ncbi:MAG: chemotaxis protein CheR [Gammaproteobacteria bacterium]|nr:chemotaxis protein CheR [Gammaproteobacteria bacterium]NIR99082.1 chemotaxis protein CheR [Gammaproteobacteria bacterium]NIT64714.1 chemotaxis protein CheR [Gammaproteobacteria bacterium]NIV21672.1 chemotaxis protein CheR [Gammaproteobacteria bacterium]NIX10634.1 chemotaxis protein CheR [Gammaproteobacteria bacterium]
MKDDDCVRFLQWALPRLRMRWPGFRKVRRQVCKRVQRRMGALALADVAAYREYLEVHPEEWAALDGLTRITISRFYRDRGVYWRLESEVLPSLAERARERGADTLRACSLGCGSGEEPYSLTIAWLLGAPARCTGLSLEVVGVDADLRLLERARRACYGYGSMKELPEAWRDEAFAHTSDGYCLRAPFRAPVRLVCQDVRSGIPDGPYDMVLCRNLAFTYFDDPLQRQIGEMILAALRPGGVLVVGSHERLPEGHGFTGLAGAPGLYARPAGAGRASP